MEVGEDLAIATSVEEATSALQRLEQSQDPAERILRATYCAGIEQLADYESEDSEATFSAESWRSFLIDTGENWAVDLVGEAVHVIAIASAVDDFMTGIDLAAVNAGAARLYLDACARVT